MALDKAMLGLGVIGVMTYNMTEIFPETQKTVEQTTHLYQMAAQINPHASWAERNAQEARLFQSASTLRTQTEKMMNRDYDEELNLWDDPV